MTGFGRGVTTTKTFQLTVEVRSVNHRFLEIYTKFPKEWMEAEQLAKKLISQNVLRGKLDVTVHVKSLAESDQTFHINWPLIEAYKKAKAELSAVVPLDASWTMQELLSLEHALTYEKQEIAIDALTAAVEQAVEDALVGLIDMRVREGEALKKVVLQYKEELHDQIRHIRDVSPQAVQKYRERLLERIREIATSDVLEDRVLAEVALFAERVDIAEELDRLESHFEQLASTLEEDASIGRKLDFLMQEMHREINTIGSKNQSSEASVAVVHAKTILEKMREQVQNIE